MRYTRYSTPFDPTCLREGEWGYRFDYGCECGCAFNENDLLLDRHGRDTLCPFCRSEDFSPNDGPQFFRATKRRTIHNPRLAA